MSDQNKKGVNPTTSQPQSVKSFGEHKTTQGTKKVEPCKSLKQGMLEFQKLAVTAKKDGKNPHFKSNYSTLESVITAANQGNQFGLFFTQEIDYVYTGHHDTKSDVIVVTTIRHELDEETFVSKLPIILSSINMENPQKIGSAITYAKRYTLQSVYGLPSEDDDANEASNPAPKLVPTLSTKTSNHQSSRNGGPF